MNEGQVLPDYTWSLYEDAQRGTALLTRKPPAPDKGGRRSVSPCQCAKLGLLVKLAHLCCSFTPHLINYWSVITMTLELTPPFPPSSPPTPH